MTTIAENEEKSKALAKTKSETSGMNMAGIVGNKASHSSRRDRPRPIRSRSSRSSTSRKHHRQMDRGTRPSSSRSQDSEARNKARQASRRPGSNMSLNSEDRRAKDRARHSGSSHSSRDRRAKDRARHPSSSRSRAPGVQRVHADDNTLSREDRKARQASRRPRSSRSLNSEDRRAKDRARHSGSSHSSRDRRAKDRARHPSSSRSRAPGVQRLNPDDAAPSREARKAKLPNSAQSPVASNHTDNVAAAPIALHATVVNEGGADEEAAEEEIMTRPEQLFHGNIQGTAESDNIDEADKTQMCLKKKWRVVVVVILGLTAIIMGVVLGPHQFDDANAPSILAPPNVSSSPSTDLIVYKIPSPTVCSNISKGQTLESQSEMDTESFILSMEASVKGDLEPAQWLSELQDIMQEKMMPLVAGCPDIERRNLRSDTNLISVRKMNENFAYVIGNAQIDTSYETARFAVGEIEMRYTIEIIVIITLEYSNQDSDLLLNHIYNVYRSKEALAEFLQVEQTITKLKFESVKIYTPSQSPSHGPTKMHSLTPTATPTKSSRPTFNGETYSPTKAPSMNPSQKPSSVPTFKPSQNPTDSPTHLPSPSPTTPAPTVLGATQAPSPVPTPPPTAVPTPVPTFTPTISPTPAPTPLPTAGLGGPDNPDGPGPPIPAPTPPSTAAPTPAPTPLPTPPPAFVTAAPTPAPTPLPTPPPAFVTYAPTPAPTPLPASLTMDDYEDFGLGDCLSEDGSSYASGQKAFTGDSLTAETCMNYCNIFDISDLVGFTLYDNFLGSQYCNCRYNNGQVPTDHSELGPQYFGSGPVADTAWCWPLYRCYARSDLGDVDDI